MLDILVVDDEPGIRMGLAYALFEAGHQVTEAADGAQAVALIEAKVFDLAICDIRLPKVDGLSLFRRLHQTSPRTAVILMTAHANVTDAVAALHDGAYDYVIKPFDLEHFCATVVGRLVEKQALTEELLQARAALEARSGDSPIIGQSPTMVRLLDRLFTIAQSDAPVLITGESGTGKELVARAIHDRSPRRSKPFVAINCAALPDALLEAELFGHERGAFTGALRKREGRFQLADGGTVLLDEIGEISPPAQTKLLRFLQEGTIEPLGSNNTVSVDVRVLSATHQPLKALIAAGKFREDLYYRINVLDVSVPPLRERRSDLPLLLEHFLRKFTAAGKAPPAISARAFATLSRHDYPGNVREFGHAVERAVVMAQGGEIDLEHLPETIIAPVDLPPSSCFSSLPAAMREFEKAHIQQALRMAGGKRGRAADLLGISRKNLWEKLRLHGLSAPSGDEAEPRPRAAAAGKDDER